MKNRVLFTALATLAGFIFNLAHAQETLTRATITGVSGSSSVNLSDGSTVPASVGLKLSQGTTVTTGKDAQVSIQAHDGIIAVLAANSHVQFEKLSVNVNGTRNAMLFLKSGNLASSLDPSNKNSNNYAVRTEKGVALARGTTMTVSVYDNVYVVSVIAGNVTVNWAGGLSVSIAGSTPSDVTSNFGGQINTYSLSSAFASGATPGLAEALTAAAAAVATVATNTTEITSIINTIAVAAGSSPTAAVTVASATAAATEAAVRNTSLVAAAGTGGTTAVATIISTAAVTSATNAGNAAAAQLIVTSAVMAVTQAIPGTNVNNVATALTNAANTAQGNQGNNQILAGQVTAGVNAAVNQVTTTGHAVGNSNATTPITPIDPSINVSRSA